MDTALKRPAVMDGWETEAILLVIPTWNSSPLLRERFRGVYLDFLLACAIEELETGELPSLLANPPRAEVVQLPCSSNLKKGPHL